MPDLTAYTVAWICAVDTELVAAKQFLDEEHGNPDDLPPCDDNTYILGKMGKVNIVIVALPRGQYGLVSAAIVSRDLARSFPNVRFGLMVGIGGGAPNPKHDIRLGDIVVSSPGSGIGGVLQYDFGKTIQDESFTITGHLNQSPQCLLRAIPFLNARYESDGDGIDERIGLILDKKPRLQKKYQKPNPDTDKLFRSSYKHSAGQEQDCSTVCTDDSQIILRSVRGEESLMIHFGLIASANQLMKDANIRDKLSAEKDVLCFEMEAAGLMNHFPCLIIRGICDYSDTHKNKVWQGYAAMVAAAYAKDLLCEITPSKVEAENKIGDILSGLQETAQESQDVLKEQRDIAKEQLHAQKGLAKERLSKEQQRCHQLFRLKTSNRDATYEWYKERTEERAEDTCMWFLKHQHFQSWLKQKSGPLLVSADPGCGKSVLAKYLIDQGLPRSATICYFFFKSQDQDTTRQALCALLHQLFSLKPALIEHAIRKYSENGEGLINNTASLWEILQDAVKDPRVGPVIIVLDALDECAESEFKDLMRHVHSQFSSDRSEYGKLKYLLTCRPYGQILSRFWGLLKAFPNIHIPGEEESGIISQEINHVIACRINQLALQQQLSAQIKSRLEERLREASHRTYLWVYLVFDFLEKENFKKTPKGVELAVATLPRSVNEAYEQILSKTDEEPMVRRVLSIILAARRPLNLSEMNVAVNVGYELKSIDDLDLEDDKDFKTRLRSLCGLFVSIHRGSIYLLHQTAREFLLAGVTSSPTMSSKFHWHHSFTTRQTHTVLAEICVLFLNLFNSNCSLMTNKFEGFSSVYKRELFLNYSATNWGAHVREADFMDDANIIPVVLKICDTGSKSYSKWAQYSLTPPTRCLTDLMVASYYGHHSVTKLLLEKGTDINARDGHGRTPLSLAAKNGYEATVKLLLENGADMEAKDSKYSRTPLLKAARNGHVATAKLLLEKGAFTEAKDRHLRTPLWQAIIHLHYATIQLLLEKGADTNCIDIDADTPLVFAIEKRNHTLLKLLLDKGASVECTNGSSETPLLVAVKRGFKDIVELLLEKGAAVDCQNRSGETPLLVATQSGYSDMVKLLLEKGAAIECKSRYGQTPLLAAANWGHNGIVELLLEKGAAVECRNVYRKTPLIVAAQRGYGNIVKQLLEKGASVVSEDIFGQTALACAVDNRHEAMVNILRKASQENIIYS